MRVTHSMIFDHTLRNIQANYAAMQRTNDQISTGRRYNRASENPTAVARIMHLRSEEARVEQYRRNADDAIGWLNATDNALQTAGGALQRARELAVAAGNDAIAAEERDMVAGEIDQLLMQVTDVANTTHNGEYIFGGRQIASEPYVAGTPPVYQGDLNPIEREINDGVRVQINTLGPDAFQGVMQALTDLAADLRADDGPAIRSRIADIDAAHDRMLAANAAVGARTNRIETQSDRLAATQVSLAGLRSKDDEVDMVEAIVRFQSEELVYNASLQAGARLMQQSLLDFLR
jgi:flagellar hook-associated protein 3 FlgL